MTNQDNPVRAWEATVTIPTYRIGDPDKNPMFLEKRVYQGSSGVVYPHPVIDRVFDEKADQDYTAVYLENRYLKIMLLPEIGGRVQMALDKTNNYHFVYHNTVIKPALVGLTGPWISGGIEFNWPQHHRPSTFEPVDYRIEANADGSATVWFSEIERMFRTKGMIGFTLYSDRAYLELAVQLYNRTSEPQTFLWWANPAVQVNDDYQSVFPPDVHAVMDHGKRDVSSFPIATGTYYKYDYAPGTDISRYKNIPVPTSYMAYHSDFDFLGCYDHGVQAGMMHVANHHVVPGKKQWTWGCGDFGQAWDRQLTDEDGPYIELMCGAYTDNQPDFSWLMPGETKQFTQIFMPYKQVGAAKNASHEAVINLAIEAGEARIGVYVSRPRTVTVRLLQDGAPVYTREAALTPEAALLDTVAVDGAARPQQFTLQVLDGDRLVLAYTPVPDEKPDIPDPATAARPPAEIETNEALYLNGLHLEQYRHATYEPEPYYMEALRRDPLDSRANNALGLLLFRRGKFAEAEAYFRTAVEALTRRNPNPYDGEPYYNLGLSLRMQARYAEAVDAFYKAVWNVAWRSPAYFELARLACRRGQFEEALDLLDNALATNTRYQQARHLQMAVLRRLHREADARAAVDASLALDRLDSGAWYERGLLTGDTTYRDLMRGYVHNYIELALDYAHAGLFDEAQRVLDEAPLTDPMVRYYQGWCHTQAGDSDAAARSFAGAQAVPSDYCFPQRIEAVPALQAALMADPADGRAAYYLGNFWYAHRRYDEAITAWELAYRLDPAFPTVQRNLGLAAVNKRHDLAAALAYYERAFALDETDARVYFELDQLRKKMGADPEARLAALEQHRALVDQRDDLTIEYIALLNLRGQVDAALHLLTTRTFHPWEGGEGKTTGQYVLTLVEIAKRQLAAGQYDSTIDSLQRAQTYPHNLGEGKLAIAQENHIHYYLGLAYAGQGDPDRARASFQQAAVGSSEPTSAMYYNDQPPDMIFYQGLARQQLGEESAARAIFETLVAYGSRHLDDDITMDYFAVSLPDFLVFDEDLNQRNRIHCHYMQALGYLGLQDYDSAARQFAAVLALDPAHLGAVIHRAMLPAGIEEDSA
jgi:tetratricopeptide (TPR) repeat protein